ncbi:MAG: hypothetical protein H0V17_18150 [Deltaproteobacteria bacterium]|nr:hypothetical protein [Deltaproteobacteria bacterium]
MGRFFRTCVLSLIACGACGESEDFPDNPDLPDSGPFPDTTPPTDGGDGGSPTDGMDGEPPVITIVNPLAGDILNGSIQIEATVTDDSQPVTVGATMGGLTITMVRVGSTETFRGTFDTAPLAGFVGPTIIVRASDNGGLTSEVGIQVVLDNEGPISSLDPPQVRTQRIAGGGFECSREFDPLGSDAPDDGQVVAQLFELRGRVHDLSNTGTLDPQNSLVIPKAGTKTAQVYVFDDATKPLVVDTDGDGECDEINPDIVPATVPMAANEAAVVDLVAIDPAGSGFFPSETFGGFNSGSCTSGTDTESPDPVCFGESATIVIQDLDGAPEIFGLPAVSDFNCMGFAFDARAQNISDGFACVALRVTDNLGNVRVSEPLRICIDSNLSGGDCNGTALGGIVAAGSRPNCTGTVTGGTVTTTACTPRRFFSGVANEFELISE